MSTRTEDRPRRGLFARAAVMAGLSLAFVRPAQSSGFKVEVGASYYAISDQLFKTVYGSGGVMPGLALAYGFKRLELRAETGYFAADGAMTETQEELKFRMIPLLFGARYEILKSTLRPYLGIGLGSLSYEEDYPERFEDVRGSTTMTYAEAGVHYFFQNRLYLDLNARFCSAKADSFVQEKIDLGGLKLGIGLAFAF